MPGRRPPPPFGDSANGRAIGGIGRPAVRWKGDIMELKKILAASALGAAVVIGAAAPAFAVTENVGGGVWYHTGGDEGETIHSDYYHGSACHSSTAKNARGTTDKTIAARGYKSYASVPATDDVDYAYWNNQATGC